MNLYVTYSHNASPQPLSRYRDCRGSVSYTHLYFKSIYDSTRSGTNNIYPDEDNVVRWYPNFETLAGYRIPSLPYRMAQALSLIHIYPVR